MTGQQLMYTIQRFLSDLADFGRGQTVGISLPAAAWEQFALYCWQQREAMGPLRIKAVNQALEGLVVDWERITKETADELRSLIDGVDSCRVHGPAGCVAEVTKADP